MNASLDRTQARLEAAGQIPAGATPAERLINSATYALAAAGELERFTLPLVGVDEMRRMVRAESTLPGPTHHSTSLRPIPHGVHSLVDVEFVTDTGALSLVGEATRSIGADRVDVGVPLGGSRVTFSAADPVQMRPFGTAYELDEALFTQPDVVRTVIDPMVTDAWWQALDFDLVAGDGSQVSPGHSRLDGVIENTTLLATALTTQGLALACGLVGEAGFYGPLACVAHPMTLATEIFGNDQRQVAAALPLIGQWVPSLGVPEGLAIVGDWFRGLRLFLDARGLSVVGELELDTGNWFLRVVNRAHSWIRNPGAFAVLGEEVTEPGASS